MIPIPHEERYNPAGRLVDESPAQPIPQPGAHGRGHVVIMGKPGQVENNGDTIKYFFWRVDRTTVMIVPTLDAARLQPGEDLKFLRVQRRRMTLPGGGHDTLSQMYLQGSETPITIGLWRRIPHR